MTPWPRRATSQAGEQARILPKVYAPWNAYTHDLDSPELAKHWHTQLFYYCIKFFYYLFSGSALLMLDFCSCGAVLTLVKVSKFQNVLMKSSFFPKYRRTIVKICALQCSLVQYREEILKIFGSYFVRNDAFVNSFWNSLTFSKFPPKKKRFNNNLLNWLDHNNPCNRLTNFWTWCSIYRKRKWLCNFFLLSLPGSALVMLDFCCCGAVLTLVQPVEPEELKSKIKSSLLLLSSTPLPSLSSGPRGPRRLLESRSSSISCRLDPNLLAKKASGDYSQDFRHQVKKHWLKPVHQRIQAHRPFHRLHQVGRTRPGGCQREGGRQPTRQGGGSRLTQLIRRWHVRRLGLIGRNINFY